MSVGTKVQPSDIAALGDDILDHLKHFSPGERVAVALYLLSVVAAGLAAEDNSASMMLAAQAMEAGMAERTTQGAVRPAVRTTGRPT